MFVEYSSQPVQRLRVYSFLRLTKTDSSRLVGFALRPWRNLSYFLWNAGTWAERAREYGSSEVSTFQRGVDVVRR